MKKRTSLAFTWEAEWVKEAKKAKPWYSRTPSGITFLIVLATVDLGGFIQGILSYPHDLSTQSYFKEATDLLVSLILVLGFVAAFEGATIYMAYAFSLRLYHYDRYALKRIGRIETKPAFSRFVSTTSLGWICFCAFLFGVIANIVFRIGLINDFSLIQDDKLNPEITLNFVMVLLPIITSILNFVIGCFTFDPILFELNHLSKKISKIEASIEQINSMKNQANEELARIGRVKAKQGEILDSKIICVTSLRPVLRSRIYEDAMRDA